MNVPLSSDSVAEIWLACTQCKRQWAWSISWRKSKFLGCLPLHRLPFDFQWNQFWIFRTSHCSLSSQSLWHSDQACNNISLKGCTLSGIWYVQYRGFLCPAQNIIKKDPGRARKNSLATAGPNFTKPGAQNKGDLYSIKFSQRFFVQYIFKLSPSEASWNFSGHH